MSSAFAPLPSSAAVSRNTDFNTLPESDKQAVAARLLRIKESGWKPFWCNDPSCDGSPHWMVTSAGENVFMSETDIAGPLGEPLGDVIEEDDGTRLRPVLDANWAHNHAREDQRLPNWLMPWILFIMSGRGAGKTTTGVEFVTMSARRGLDGAILGRRGTELVNTHVATIIERAHPEFVPVHWASKDILEWPNGAITYLFSAEKPENIRSVNLSYAWVDEAAFMDEIETAWMNLRLATRIEKPDNPIHFLITSTPTGSKWVQEMEDDEEVIVRRVSTYANKANLSKDFLAALRKNYEGTRIGRQELYGEVLRDVEGALWNDDMFSHDRVKPEDWPTFLESMDDRVLAVDPAGSKGKHSDATGIIGVGARHTDENGNALANSTFSVLGDATIKGTPTEWAEQTFRAARLWRVNRIVAEKNFGGDMVEQVLRDYARQNPTKAKDHEGEDFRIQVVRAHQSKEVRAEGTVGKYEQGRVSHTTCDNVFGDLSDLEREQTTWVPKSRGGKMPSPNRVDALVWAVRALETAIKFQAQTAHQKDLADLLRGAPTSNVTPFGAPVTQVPEVPTETRAPRQAAAHHRQPAPVKTFPVVKKGRKVTIR